MGEVQTKSQKTHVKKDVLRDLFGLVLWRVGGRGLRNIHEFGVADVFELFLLLLRWFRNVPGLLPGSWRTQERRYDSPDEPRKEEEDDRPDKKPKEHLAIPCSLDYSTRWELCWVEGFAPEGRQSLFHC